MKLLTASFIFLLIFSSTNLLQVMFLVTLILSPLPSLFLAHLLHKTHLSLPLWISLPYHVKCTSSLDLITFKSKVNMLNNYNPLVITYHTKTYHIPSITYFYLYLINDTISSILILFVYYCSILFVSFKLDSLFHLAHSVQVVLRLFGN